MKHYGFCRDSRPRLSCRAKLDSHREGVRRHDFVFRLVAASILLVAAAPPLASGQTDANPISTIVNANSCFTKQIHQRPLVFCGGGFAGDGGPAEKAKLSVPMGLAVDRFGNLFIADTGNRRIRRVEAATGVITTVAGDSSCRSGNCPGGVSHDGKPATKEKLESLWGGIALDDEGNIFACEIRNDRVRRVDHATGVITTIAGNGTRGFSGDGGLATNAQLHAPESVTVDASGNVFIGDSGNRRVRRVEAATGIITTVAGGGSSCRFRGPVNYPPKECPALDTGLGDIAAVLVDDSGNVYLAEAFWNAEVRRVDHATGMISWVAGGGCPPQGGSCGWGFAGDGGPADQSRLSVPSGLALDAAGNLYISDTGNGRIRRIDHSTGIITTIAGSGGKDFGRDGEPAMSASLNSPRGVAVDANGNLFIADTNGHSVRKIKIPTK